VKYSQQQTKTSSNTEIDQTYLNVCNQTNIYSTLSNSQTQFSGIHSKIQKVGMTQPQQTIAHKESANGNVKQKHHNFATTQIERSQNAYIDFSSQSESSINRTFAPNSNDRIPKDTVTKADALADKGLRPTLPHTPLQHIHNNIPVNHSQSSVIMDGSPLVIESSNTEQLVSPSVITPEIEVRFYTQLTEPLRSAEVRLESTAGASIYNNDTFNESTNYQQSSDTSRLVELKHRKSIKNQTFISTVSVIDTPSADVSKNQMKSRNQSSIDEFVGSDDSTIIQIDNNNNLPLALPSPKRITHKQLIHRHDDTLEQKQCNDNRTERLPLDNIRIKTLSNDTQKEKNNNDKSPETAQKLSPIFTHQSDPGKKTFHEWLNDTSKRRRKRKSVKTSTTVRTSHTNKQRTNSHSKDAKQQRMSDFLQHEVDKHLIRRNQNEQKSKRHRAEFTLTFTFV